MNLMTPVESAKYLGVKVNTFATYVRSGLAKVTCSDDGLEWGWSKPNLDRIKNGERKREIEKENEEQNLTLPFFSMADSEAEKRGRELMDRIRLAETRIADLENLVNEMKGGIN